MPSVPLVPFVPLVPLVPLVPAELNVEELVAAQVTVDVADVLVSE